MKKLLTLVLIACLSTSSAFASTYTSPLDVQVNELTAGLDKIASSNEITNEITKANSAVIQAKALLKYVDGTTLTKQQTADLLTELSFAKINSKKVTYEDNNGKLQDAKNYGADKLSSLGLSYLVSVKSNFSAKDIAKIKDVKAKDYKKTLTWAASKINVNLKLVQADLSWMNDINNYTPYCVPDGFTFNYEQYANKSSSYVLESFARSCMLYGSKVTITYYDANNRLIKNEKYKQNGLDSKYITTANHAIFRVNYVSSKKEYLKGSTVVLTQIK